MLQRFLDKYPNSIKIEEINQRFLDIKFKVVEAKVESVYDIQTLNEAIKLCNDFAKSVESKSKLYSDKAIAKKNELEKARPVVYNNEIIAKVDSFGLKDDAESRAYKISNKYNYSDKFFDVELFSGSASISLDEVKNEDGTIKFIYSMRKSASNLLGGKTEDARILVSYAVQGGDATGVQGFSHIETKEY